MSAARCEGSSLRSRSVPELREIYISRQLARTAQGDFTGYAIISNSELLGVAENIKPELAPERTAQLLAAIKHRIEASYLPDGRLLPARLRNSLATPAPEGSQCQAHSTGPTLICSRCGTFFCSACASPVKSHCAPCFEPALNAR